MKTKKQLKLNIREAKLLGDLVLMTAIKPEGALVNPAQYEDKPEYGEVLSVGDRVNNIKVGDVILFGMYSTEKIRSNGEDYYLIHEEDVKAIF